MKLLSYHKKLKKTAFTFACEVILLSSNKINCPKYKNNSFSTLEIFLHINNGTIVTPSLINYSKIYKNLL